MLNTSYDEVIMNEINRANRNESDYETPSQSANFPKGVIQTSFNGEYQQRQMKNPNNNTKKKGDTKFKFTNEGKERLNSSVDEMLNNQEIMAVAYMSEQNSPNKNGRKYINQGQQ